MHSSVQSNVFNQQRFSISESSVCSRLLVRVRAQLSRYSLVFLTVCQNLHIVDWNHPIVPGRIHYHLFIFCEAMQILGFWLNLWKTAALTWFQPPKQGSGGGAILDVCFIIRRTGTLNRYYIIAVSIPDTLIVFPPTHTLRGRTSENVPGCILLNRFRFLQQTTQWKLLVSHAHSDYSSPEISKQFLGRQLVDYVN